MDDSPRSHGVIQIILAVLWIFMEAELWYNYHIKGGFYFFMKPDWNIYLNIGLGFMGIFIGIKTWKGKLKTWKGYVAIMGLFVLGYAIGFLVNPILESILGFQ